MHEHKVAHSGLRMLESRLKRHTYLALEHLQLSVLGSLELRDR